MTMRAAVVGAVLGVMLGLGAVAAAGAADLPGARGSSLHGHYYPFSGEHPRVGRLEDPSARSESPAENFERSWSVSSVFPYEMIMREPDRDIDAEPSPGPAEPARK